ncbi:MAG: helix-turn-helix domain-containing protein [Solirubrobacteraceae bacterium]|jgi:excisionase family DNA binding protein
MIAPTADSGEDLLTAAEVAALLRMTSGWVYAETRAKRIPHLRLGRYVRYRRSAIEQWMGEIETGRTLAPMVSLGARRAASARRPAMRA